MCGENNLLSLKLRFEPVKNGEVFTTFQGNSRLQGYDGIMHGGVISALLDSAMTNCLFAHGHAAVTAELKVRFRHPVSTERPARVRAWIASSLRPLHELAAEGCELSTTAATLRAMEAPA